MPLPELVSACVSGGPAKAAPDTSVSSDIGSGSVASCNGGGHARASVYTYIYIYIYLYLSLSLYIYIYRSSLLLHTVPDLRAEQMRERNEGQVGLDRFSKLSQGMLRVLYVLRDLFPESLEAVVLAIISFAEMEFGRPDPDTVLSFEANARKNHPHK